MHSAKSSGNRPCALAHRALLVEQRTFSYDKHGRALLRSLRNLIVAQCEL